MMGVDLLQLSNNVFFYQRMGDFMMTKQIIQISGTHDIAVWRLFGKLHPIS